MSAKKFLMTYALAGAVALPSFGSAASAGSVRSWGGAWIGFGAGYAGSTVSSSNQSRPELCMTSTRQGAGIDSSATCVFSGPQVITDAETLSLDGDTAAGAKNTSATMHEDTAVAAYSGSIAMVQHGDTVEGGSLLVLHLATDGTAILETSASGGGPGGTGDASYNTVTDSSNPSHTIQFYRSAYSGPPMAEEAYSAGLAGGNSRTGVFGAASYATAAVGASSAEALAIGFSGLPQGDLSGTDGGLSPDIHARYDYQTESNVIFGTEVSFTMPGGEGTNASQTISFDPEQRLTLDRGFETKTNYLASARLRLGYAMGDFMAYATGGLAYTDFKATATTTGDYEGHSITESASDSANALGGVIGGGVSTFVSDNATVSLEGLYYAFDRQIDFNEGNVNAKVSLDDSFSVMMKFSIRAD